MIFLKKYNLPFGASIGAIYGVPRSYTSAELIQYSDELMYKAKRAGKGRVIIEELPSKSFPQERMKTFG